MEGDRLRGRRDGMWRYKNEKSKFTEAALISRHFNRRRLCSNTTTLNKNSLCMKS